MGGHRRSLGTEWSPADFQKAVTGGTCRFSPTQVLHSKPWNMLPATRGEKEEDKCRAETFLECQAYTHGSYVPC